MMAVEVSTRGVFRPGIANALFSASTVGVENLAVNYDVSADGQRFVIVQQVAAETGYPDSGIDVRDFTQIVAERLHREDANWGRRLNDSGVIGKDTVAYKTSTGHPYSIDIVAGSMSSNPQPHWSEHGVVGGVWIKP